MKKLALGLLIVSSCAIAGWTVYQQTKTTPLEVTVGEESSEITLLNTATGEISRQEWTMTPATDPKTGKRTLVQGMYCATCQKWYPAPPPEMAQQFPGGPVCPKDRTRMSVDGPLVPNQPAGG